MSAGELVKPFGRPFQRVSTVTASNKEIAQANPRRRAIVIGNLDQFSTAYISINLPGAQQIGIALPPTDPFIELHERDHGRLVQAQFTAAALLVGSPLAPTGPFHPVVGSALSGATTGVKLSITPTAGFGVVVSSASVSNFTGAPVVALQVVSGGVTAEIARGSAAFSYTGAVGLLGTDVLQWNVITAVAASVFDAHLAGTGSTNAGNTPASISVGVWELEG